MNGLGIPLLISPECRIDQSRVSWNVASATALEKRTALLDGDYFCYSSITAPAVTAALATSTTSTPLRNWPYLPFEDSYMAMTEGKQRPSDDPNLAAAC